jgi:hypothetical protein
MNAVTVLKVFRNSSLITEQGEFKISRVFDDGKTAGKARFVHYRTINGIAIYARHGRAGKLLFAVVDKQNPCAGYFNSETGRKADEKKTLQNS